MTNKQEFYLRSERIEQLAAKLELASDPELHATALELVQCVMDLHGAGLDRMMQILLESEQGDRLLLRFLDDNLVSSLLLLHNLHPEELETRVERAIQKMLPQLHSHSCELELASIRDGVVHLRLLSAGGGCGSTASTMRSLVEDAMTEAAPDATRIVIETVQPPATSQLVTIAQIAPNGEESHGTSAHHAR